ncbi:MAG TPA: glutamate--tRNA ligase [Flavobacteriaceae bacterium]|nr:glutamate--tRNA ligase [Flavobacteriaceae bacterium]
MSKKVRVRFAPSPTGPLHIGGVRTALYNYLFAKKFNGDFILRIEDTDQNRFVEGAEEYIVEALNWLNIPFDEGPGKEGDCGPYRQSERKGMYKDYAMQLLDSGNAYYAFDTAEELAALRKEYEGKGETFIYNWHNREELNNSLNMDEATLKEKLDSGEEYVIRFKSPASEVLELEDMIRGKMKVDTSTLDDKVLFKSDGMPTYHLANIVDDETMRITHVIRGEEWLPSLALHKMLYRAFGWEAPEFAHLPLIMKPVGKGKLSKRDGDKMGFPVFPLEWHAPDGEVASGYRESGYLPEAVINMLALLGWNPGTEQEIFSLDELVKTFHISRVHKSGAKFNPEKTDWFQHQYMQKKEDSFLVNALEVILKEKNIDSSIDLKRVVTLLKERISFTKDLWEQGDFFFVCPTEYDEKAKARAVKEDTAEILQKVAEILSEQNTWGSTSLSDVVKDWVEEEKIGFGRVMMPLRLSLVGEMKGPDVFEIIELLGKEKSVSRIKSFIEEIN